MAYNRALVDYEKSIQKDKPFPATLGAFVDGSFQFVVATNPTLAYVRYLDGFQTTAKHRNRVDLTLDPADPDNQDNPIALYFDEYEELAIWGPDPDQGGALLERDPLAGAGGLKDVVAGTGITIDKTNPVRPIINAAGTVAAGLLYIDDTGVDVVNTVTETDLYSGSGSGSVTIPANFATPSVVIDGEIGAYFSTPGLVNSRFRLYIGSTVVLDFAFTVIASVADFMRIRWNFFGKGTISAADYSSYAEVLAPAGGAITTPYYFQNAASPVDLSVPNVVQFTIEWGAADPLAEIISTPGAFIAYRST